MNSRGALLKKFSLLDSEFIFGTLFTGHAVVWLSLHCTVQGVADTSLETSTQEDVVVPFCFNLLPSLDGCSNVLPRVEARDSLSIWAGHSAETRFGSGLIPLGLLGPLLH